MEIVIIKYNAGNTQSVLFALERIGVSAIVTDDIEKIRSADKIIFPGVGEASSAMKYLKNKKLDMVIKNLNQPVLGICLGMQLMCNYSEENNTHCLGIFNTMVKKFDNTNKVPQIGWNNIEQLSTPLFDDIAPNSYCYFVHSYYAALCEETIAVTNYNTSFSSALLNKNFTGVQFHPEKSANIGAKILKNFLEKI